MMMVGECEGKKDIVRGDDDRDSDRSFPIRPTGHRLFAGLYLRACITI